MNGFVDATGRAIQFVGDRNVTRSPRVPRARLARSANARMLGVGVGIAPLALAAGTSPAVSRLSGMGDGPLATITSAPMTPGAASSSAPATEPNWAEKIFGIEITGRDVQGGKGATISAPPTIVLAGFLGAGMGAVLGQLAGHGPWKGALFGGIAAYALTQGARAAGRYGF